MKNMNVGAFGYGTAAVSVLIAGMLALVGNSNWFWFLIVAVILFIFGKMINNS
ncbi:MAG TPA: hypothetical protein PK685_02435 [archaeon]|nr:hypothetical protein [archaeon]